MSDERPNILLITTDQQRFDCIGYDGDGVLRTPHLDAVAKAGAIFTCAYTNSPLCVPARASVLTGQPCRDHGADRRPLPEGAWTFVRALREAGYETAAFGKMHFHPMRADHGFDLMRLAEHDPSQHCFGPRGDDYQTMLWSRGLRDWLEEWQFPSKFVKAPEYYQKALQAVPSDLPEEVYSTSWIARQAAEFLRARRPGRPWFIWLSFLRPHHPFSPPSPYDAMYDQASLPLPDGGIGDKERLPKAVRESLEERAAHRVFDLRPMDDALLRRIIAYYYGTISQIDARAADVLEEIETERTLILFHSDHGDYLGRRSRLFKDPNIAYDDLARIPLFMTWPGRVPAGVRVARPVTLADLAPTILEAAGAPVPESVRGESLLKAIARREGRERPAFIETSSSWRFLAVRSGDWKLTMYENGDRELYNLREDPREWRNRAGESEVKEVEEKLAAEITRFRAGG